MNLDGSRYVSFGVRENFYGVAHPDVAGMLENTLLIWHSSGTDLPRFEPRYTVAEQRRREHLLDHRLEAIDAELRKTSRAAAVADRTIGNIASLFVQVSADALNIGDPAVQDLLQNGFSQIGTELARHARTLDPEISMIDILQAARNAWTACGLQVLLGKPVQLTRAIFAYSMLYPYSDNYMDDPAVSPAEKLRFSERFREWLKGIHVNPANRREEMIWRLIRLIEDEYPRANFAAVYESLLAIHRAQEDSMRQIQNARRDEIDLVRLTFSKGGTSVLADAYLAAGELTAAEALFAFNWGVVLQLGDDLQDLYSDREHGSLTLFTRAAARGMLDEITNRTLHFSQSVMTQMAALPKCSLSLKDLLAGSSRMLLIRSAANAPDAFTRAYLAELEQYSPFRFDFLRSREQRFLRRRRSYARLFEQVVSAFPSRTTWLRPAYAPQLSSFAG
jgi:hypothetical protein